MALRVIHSRVGPISETGAASRVIPKLTLLPPDPAGAPRGWWGSVGISLLEAPWIVWATLDVLATALGVYAGYAGFVWHPGGQWVQFSCLQTSLVACPVLIASGLVFGLYEQQTLLRGSRVLARSLLSAGAAAGVTALIILLCVHTLQSRGVLATAFLVYLGTAPYVRLLVSLAIRHDTRRFVIVGTQRNGWPSIPMEGQGLSKRYQLVGYIATEPTEKGRTIDGYPVLGTTDELERVCQEHQIDEVVVGSTASRNRRVLDKSLRCLRLGCRVTNLSTFYEQVLSEVPVSHLEPTWFLFADLKHYRESQMMIKRACDILGAFVGLVVSLPLWPILALIIKLDSPGPVFYHQQRVGLNGRVFTLHKFRTMVMTAEKNGHAWASVDDPRVTPMGRILRRSRLDELPQLWNILLGEMSIIGPRPERPEFVEQLAEQIPFYNERHLVKPGLSGWAQINYRYGASVEDARRKLQLDLWYIKHMSLELDLIIVFRTLGTVFLGSR